FKGPFNLVFTASIGVKPNITGRGYGDTNITLHYQSTVWFYFKNVSQFGIPFYFKNSNTEAEGISTANVKAVLCLVFTDTVSNESVGRIGLTTVWRVVTRRSSDYRWWIGR